jgi:hypothetical protein
MPTLRAMECGSQRSILQVTLPDCPPAVSSPTQDFMFLDQVCIWYDDMEDQTNIMIMPFIGSSPGQYSRAVRLLFGPEIHAHLVEDWLVSMDHGSLKGVRELQITDEQYAHILRMIDYDLNPNHHS